LKRQAVRWIKLKKLQDFNCLLEYNLLSSYEIKFQDNEYSQDISFNSGLEKKRPRSIKRKHQVLSKKKKKKKKKDQEAFKKASFKVKAKKTRTKAIIHSHGRFKKKKAWNRKRQEALQKRLKG